MKGYKNEVKSVFSLCLHVIIVLLLCTAFLTAQSGGITAKDQKAKEAVDAALKALGGADKIGDIKSLIFKGRQSLLSNENPIEIMMLLPDSVVQIVFPGGSIGLTSWQGVSKGTLLPEPENIPNMTVFKTREEYDKIIAESKILTKEQMARRNARVNELGDEWSYFLIGLLMKNGPTPLTISSGSKPGVFALTKNDGEEGEIEFDTKTGYPSVVRYRIPKHTQYEEIKFQNRFSVNGIMFPRQILVSSPEMLKNTLRDVEEIQINPELSLQDFEEFAEAPTFIMPKRQ